jgi:hypothetical protein
MTNKWVPCGIPVLGNVVAHYSPKTSHVSITHSSTYLPRCHPSHLPLYLPHKSYGCATCDPCSGDTCNSLIGPLVPIHISIHSTFPLHMYGRMTCIVSYHVALYGLYSQHYFFLFGQMNKLRYLGQTRSI